MNGTIRVALVADVRLYRASLVSSLGSQPTLTVVAAVSGAAEMRTLRLPQPDVIVLDVATHDSQVIAATLAREFPQAKIIGFGVAEVDDELLACAANGLAGYVRCEASLGELVSMIESVTRDELPCSPRAASMLFRHVGALCAGPSAAGGPPLTSRERQILELIDQALSNKEIAHTLNVELSTVKNHVHNILDKLKVSRRSEAAARLRQDMRMAKAELARHARSVRLRISPHDGHAEGAVASRRGT